jgi:hypothetical protein
MSKKEEKAVMIRFRDDDLGLLEFVQDETQVKIASEAILSALRRWRIERLQDRQKPTH